MFDLQNFAQSGGGGGLSFLASLAASTRIASISSNETWDANTLYFQYLDTGASGDYTITLPALTAGYTRYLINSGTPGVDNNLIVVDAGSNQVANLGPGATAVISATASMWVVSLANTLDALLTSVSLYLSGNNITCKAISDATKTSIIGDPSGANLEIMQLNGSGLGLFGSSPSGQGGAIGDATGGVVVDAEARTALNSILAQLRTRGEIAT